MPWIICSVVQKLQKSSFFVSPLPKLAATWFGFHSSLRKNPQYSHRLICGNRIIKYTNIINELFLRYSGDSNKTAISSPTFEFCDINFSTIASNLLKFPSNFNDSDVHLISKRLVTKWMSTVQEIQKNFARRYRIGRSYTWHLLTAKQQTANA